MSGTVTPNMAQTSASVLPFTLARIANLPLPLGVPLKGGKIVHDARSLARQSNRRQPPRSRPRTAIRRGGSLATPTTERASRGSYRGSSPISMIYSGYAAKIRRPALAGLSH
jgi:hypothetical protein